ncbi:MAG: YifB family Mg chelatase-like AAA ATPase [Gammaproteobacteria bacterium]|nr:MAG: YifB family Mg chelatase-like AAA ATPase [Gammaproteobacteria bacterium]
MSLAVVYSRALTGVAAPLVTVETHLTNGLPALSIVGLPEAAVRESKDRVRSALINAGFEFPARRITINLAPADLPKEGGRFDLPIAIGILVASGQLSRDTVERHELIGELALTGEIRAVRGSLVAALHTCKTGRILILPANCAEEAALADTETLVAASHLLEVVGHLNGTAMLPGLKAPEISPQHSDYDDLTDVRGQHQAKRALEIAAAGGHSLLFIGPPGSGKTMLATRLPGILPDMDKDAALETASILSISEQRFDVSLWRKRPFRAPHHTASGVALVGGGSTPRPGEISLAHNGVLFLDELPEFDRRVLEVLREPLESGRITISRAARQADFPARFQLIAAMNPCPCGHLGDPSGRCHCTTDQVQRYRGRISGPLLDRIDLHVDVPALSHNTLLNPRLPAGESSASVRGRVLAARNIQYQRQQKTNQGLSQKELEEYCALDDESRAILDQAMVRLGLSARAYHRILKVARTIADLAGSSGLSAEHIAEAVQYRTLDRQTTHQYAVSNIS